MIFRAHEKKKRNKNRRKARLFKESRQKHRRADLENFSKKANFSHTGPKRGYAHLMHRHVDRYEVSLTLWGGGKQIHKKFLITA